MKTWICFGTIVLLPALAWSSPGRVRSVYLDDQKIEQISVKPGKLTTLHFPLKPDDSALGMQKAFELHYIKNDIIIGALRPVASTNLVVYLLGRRFTFDVNTSAGVYDEIINVLDADTPQSKPSRVSGQKKKRVVKNAGSQTLTQIPEVIHE